MAGGIKNIFTEARCCYAVTKSLGQTLRFIAAGNNNHLFSILLPTGKKIQLRRNKTDRDVFLSTFFNQYHRINYPLGKAPVIIDLGSNIGLTIIDYLQQYPDAVITGVEMDEGNFAIAKQNTAPYPAVTLLHRAAWKEDGHVMYNGADTQSYGIAAEGIAVAAISLSSLLANMPKVDLLKMDIEGAEYPVLLGSSDKRWLSKIKYLNIEVHNTAEENAQTGMQKIIEELRAHNFEAVASNNHWSSVIAVNKGLA